MINDARVGVQWANEFPTLDRGGLNNKYVCEKWQSMIVFQEHFKILFSMKIFSCLSRGFWGIYRRKHDKCGVVSEHSLLTEVYKVQGQQILEILLEIVLKIEFWA